MEDFSVPLLADRAYHTLNPNNNNNNNNNNTTMHHHKDHMLAAGSTPSTTAFLYDNTSSATATTAAGQSLKSQMSMAMKSDYSTFTTCIQQSALLDHRNAAIDANLDAGVSLGALCDLKFPTNGLSAQLMNETTTTTSPLMCGLPKHNPNGCSTTFSNILFNREDALHHSNADGPGSSANNQPHRLLEQHQQQYLTLKGTNDVQNTADTTPPHHHYVTNTASNTTATNTTTHHLHAPPNDVSICSNIGGSNTSPPDNNNLLDYGLASSITASSPTSSSSVALAHHPRLNTTTTNTTTSESTKNLTNAVANSSTSCSSSILLNENHITTTTNASMINTPTSDSAEAQHTASKNIMNSQAGTATAATCNVQQSTSQQQQQHQHSIEEIGGVSACTSTSSTASNSNTLNGNTGKPVFLIIKETSYPNNGNNNSKTETTPQPQSQSQSQPQPQQQMALQHTERAVAATSNNHQQQQQRLQSHHHMNTNAAYEQSQQLQQQHHLLNSSSNLSSDSNDSMSSSDDFIEMEANERAGYQDTTSSHSQQSANGGGGGGSGSNPNSSNPSAGVSLINGVVTLNSQNSNALSNNGGGGGSSASSASGTYMSLLPPNVGATSSSSAGHLVSGVTALGAGGTSATASGSTPEVIDFKHLFEELCPVCGDKVSGYHYGLLTCESCKGFFKRTVQNKKVYTCVAERSCHIDKTQRKRCPYCRFQKCLEVGMKLEAVRADRMRGGRNKFGPMYKRDRARKLQVMRQRQIALQALRTSMGTGEMKATPLSPGYQQAYTNMNIKQEIQIPQVSSLTQSPDSSPSPIAIALGQVNASSGVITTPMNGSSGAGGGGGGGGGGGTNNSGNNNSSNTNDGINRVGSGSGGGSGNCHETGTGSLQNASESKLCFDSGTHPSSTADSIEPLRVSPMIREFVQSIDDREWQTQLFALLQKQTYNQVEVDIFELMCKVLDQNLFSQVDWARNTVFFKDLKVDDQMKLLQHSWSDMLVLDHLHQRIHNGLPDETQLNNGQVFNLLSLGLLGVPQLADYFNELQNKLQDLKFDMGDYVCMKFLILLNPDVRGIINKKTVLQGHENVQAALLDYTLTCYPSVTDKFRRLLSILPDIHAMAARGEEHLYSKHCAGSAPTQTLLMEMLHAKRKV